MRRITTRQELLENSYRKIEAMYRRGKDIADICRATGLSRMDVIDTTQKIFALDVERA